MDEINDFFDFSKPLVQRTINIGAVHDRVASNPSLVGDEPSIKRKHIGAEYAEEYKAQEQHAMIESSMRDTINDAESNMDTMDDIDVSVAGDSIAGGASNRDGELLTDAQRKHVNQVYSAFDFTHNVPGDLSILPSRKRILEAIRNNAVTIIQGSTGCGKTTQVPQFILDTAFERNEFCNIIVTQPRRIAATSIARRVCAERKWPLGSVVGYQISLDAVVSEDTCLVYCTTGVLLQQLIKQKNMSRYTHVIIDEVHERDSETDFLMILIRRFLTTNSPRVKLILMSATFNATHFSDYFRLPFDGLFKQPPIIDINQPNKYSVQEFYSCDLKRLNIELDIRYDVPEISEGAYQIALKLMVYFESFDRTTNEGENKPTVLIFLPGLNEIQLLYKLINKKINLNHELKWLVLPLHSSINLEEQQRVFRKPPPGFRNIILATNIAESSITVPDVKYVIDFCLARLLATDRNTNFAYLRLEWASQNNCRQRSGRAGRLMDGRVYRLVPRYFYEQTMLEESDPEILRCPLENVVLKTKLLDMGAPHSFLALAMNPPDLSDIGRTILCLKEVGALLRTCDGNYDDFDGDLTYIGRVMSSLPIDIKLSRLIIFGYTFSVLEESIQMAAGLNLQHLFDIPFGQEMKAFQHKLRWADGSGSDLFSILNAYRVWNYNHEQNFFRNQEAERAWTRQYFVKLRAFTDMSATIADIKRRCKNLGIEELPGLARTHWTDREKVTILKIIIAGAFFPHFFTQSTNNQAAVERQAYHTLNGRNPCTTVYYSGLESRYIGQMYKDKIRKLFDNFIETNGNTKVTFDEGSEKVFITFEDDNSAQRVYDPHNLVSKIAGRVSTSIYKAVKLRSLVPRTEIQVLSPSQAILYAQEKGYGNNEHGLFVLSKLRKKKSTRNSVVPNRMERYIDAKMTFMESCEKFWLQRITDIEFCNEIGRRMNEPQANLELFHSPSEVLIGDIVAASFEIDGAKKYYRAAIQSFVKISNDVGFKVKLIDYGHVEKVCFTELRQLGTALKDLIDVPPRVFECRLAELEPAAITAPRGRWTQDTNGRFLSLVNNVALVAEVYSVVEGIVAVILRTKNVNVNDSLIKNGMAQVSEENYMSKSDHDIRNRMQEDTQLHSYDRMSDQDYLGQEEEQVKLEEPPDEMCRHTLTLRGPFSPLETPLYGILKASDTKSVKVDKSSVNSVFLNTNLQDHYLRYLVAGNIQQMPNRSEVIIRQTTLLPNIPGIGPLLAMIFSPRIELKRNSAKTQYTSLLTGLGQNESTKTAIFHEHDAVLNFDVEIESADIEIINQIRYSFDTLLFMRPGSIHIPIVDSTTKYQITSKIKELILKLLTKPRKQIEMVFHNNDKLWGKEDAVDIMESPNIYGNVAIFPMHSVPFIISPTEELNAKLRVHCGELHKLSQLDVPFRNITCKLCGQQLSSLCELRIHLCSQLHRNAETDIQFKNSG